MDKIHKILHNTFSKSDWTITKPKDRLKKECYIAENDGQKIFMKFDVPVVVIKRLGKIEVAPKVLGSGEYDHTSYVIQEFIDGRYPDREWMEKNLINLAEIINLYHNDRLLILELSKNNISDDNNHIQEDLKHLDERFNSLSIDYIHTEKVKKAFSQLTILSDSFLRVPLVPIHKELNTKNILVTNNRIVFIDWDEITLSDPLWDIGMLLWWYIPEKQWQTFFDCYKGKYQMI